LWAATKLGATSTAVLLPAASGCRWVLFEGSLCARVASSDPCLKTLNSWLRSSCMHWALTSSRHICSPAAEAHAPACCRLLARWWLLAATLLLVCL
jgi:hypothetical protein